VYSVFCILHFYSSESYRERISAKLILLLTLRIRDSVYPRALDVKRARRSRRTEPTGARQLWVGGGRMR
jgi:hypothetical protein